MVWVQGGLAYTSGFGAHMYIYRYGAGHSAGLEEQVELCVDVFLHRRPKKPCTDP